MFLCGVLAAGILFGTTMLFPVLWPFSFISIAYAIVCIEGAPNLRSALTRGYFFGLGFCSVSLSFLLLAYPTDWLGFSSRMQGASVVGLVWLMCSIPVPLSLLPWAAMLHMLRKKDFFTRVSIGVLIWTACEYLRAVFATLILWTPGSPLGPHIAFTLSGLAMSGNPGLMWFAHLGGFWALSAVAYLLSAPIAEAFYRLKDTQNRIALQLSTCVVFICALSMLVPPALHTVLGKESLTVGDGMGIHLVHTHFERSAALTTNDKKHVADVVALKIREAAFALPEGGIVVLPEDSRFFEYSSYLPEEERVGITSVLQNKSITLIDSGRLAQWDGVHSVIMIENRSAEGSSVVMRKTLLAAFGEYIPAVFAAPAEVLGFNEALKTYKNLREYQPAGETFNPAGHVFAVQKTRFGVLACSEVLSANLYEQLGSVSDVLLNVSSLSAGNGSPLMFNQFLAMAKIHSVATGKPYLQATNFEPNIIVVPTYSSTPVVID